MSDENKPKNSSPNRNHHRRRRPNNKKRPQGQDKPNPGNNSEKTPPSNSQSGAKRSHSNTRNENGERSQNPNSPQRRNQNRGTNSSPNKKKRKRKPIPAKEVVSAYLDTVTRYISARKEYFENFRGNLNKKVRRAFDSYQSNLRSLRKFEDTLKPWQKEELQKSIEFFPNDSEFSSNHPEAEIAATESKERNEPIFYHELIIQKERAGYSEDTEESSGTKEDYEKYKEKLSLA